MANELTLRVPTGTDANKIFNFLKQIAANKKALRQADADFWKTHEALSQALVGAADAELNKSLLVDSLKPEEGNMRSLIAPTNEAQ